METISMILAAAFTALQLADGHSTYEGIKRGVASEGFLVQRKLIETLGLAPGIFALKIAMAAIGWFAALEAPGIVTAIVLALACAWYAKIVAGNYRIIKEAKAIPHKPKARR